MIVSRNFAFFPLASSSSRIISRGVATTHPVELASTAYGNPSTDKNHPPLVICHGLFGQKQNWNSVAKAMQRRLGNVIYAVDMRNHGASPKVDSMNYTDMAADLALFLKKVNEENGFSKSHLLGHSMGGKAAMRLAIDPHGSPLIDRLIIEDVSPKGYSTNSHAFRYYVEAMKRADLSKTRQEISKNLEEAVPDLSIRQFLLTNLQSAADKKSLEWKVNLSSIERHFEDVLGFTLPSGAFRGRTLFVYGEKSGYVPHSDRPLIRNLFPQVIFDEIKDARHWVHADQAAAFMESVCRFIEEK